MQGCALEGDGDGVVGWTPKSSGEGGYVGGMRQEAKEAVRPRGPKIRDNIQLYGALFILGVQQ